MIVSNAACFHGKLLQGSADQKIRTLPTFAAEWLLFSGCCRAGLGSQDTNLCSHVDELKDAYLAGRGVVCYTWC